MTVGTIEFNIFSFKWETKGNREKIGENGELKDKKNEAKVFFFCEK